MVALGPFQTGKVYQGDCLRLLEQVPSASVDAIVTDPPYCSSADHEKDPQEKYVQGGTKLWRPTFEGDNRSQRAFEYWSALWLGECYRVCKPGAYAMVFTDARMLPLACDAFEAGGFIRRGIVVWDKVVGRSPHTGFFRFQSEFVVWGTKGECPRNGFGPFPGVYRVPVRLDDKHHMTGKPTLLMRDLLKPMAGSGAVVLDPFAGSGSTLVACGQVGLHGLGFEMTQEYTDIANRRIQEER